MIARHAAGPLAGPITLSGTAGHLQTTPFALAVDVVLLVVAVGYVLQTRRRVRQAGGRASGWRAVAFAGGLLLVYAAVGSGLAAYSARPGVVVAQHVLLMMAAPPLLVLGRPGPVAAGQPQGGGSVARPPWRGARMGPLAVWAVYYGSMAAFFLTGLFPSSLHDPALLHGSELWFAAAGLAFSWFLVGGAAGSPRPAYWVRIVAVLAGAPAETAIGLALLLWPHPLAAGVSLATTHTAGLVLWAGGLLTSGLSLAYVLGLWCLDDSRSSAQLDTLLDAVVPLSLGDAPGSGRPSPG